MSISMILTHIIRRKKIKIKTTTNFLPTHIKHNSSKIITITYTIDSITWTFYTISFKLAIDSNISKKFLWSIRLFPVQWKNLRSIEKYSKEFFAIDREIFKGIFCDRSQKIRLKFLDRSQVFLEIVQWINRSIAKNSFEISRLIAKFQLGETMILFYIPNKTKQSKKKKKKITKSNLVFRVNFPKSPNFNYFPTFFSALKQI